MSASQQLEKSLSEQIIERMIEKLKDSEYFTKSTLNEIEAIDLTNKSKVQEVISKSLRKAENENSKTGN
jgi:CTP-dependent riboflavin kinase